MWRLPSPRGSSIGEAAASRYRQATITIPAELTTNPPSIWASSFIGVSAVSRRLRSQQRPTCNTTFTEMYAYSSPGAMLKKRLRVARSTTLDLEVLIPTILTSAKAPRFQRSSSFSERKEETECAILSLGFWEFPGLLF